MPPKPTPTAVLASRGSWRAQTREGEPTPALATAKPPKDLPADARKVWKTLAPGLIATGVLTAADVLSFSRYCRLLVAWGTAMTAVETGATRENVLTLAKLDEMVRKLEAGFGLNPSERTGIRTEQAPETGKGRFFETRVA